MRPHRLAFSALGPYPGDVEVDFDRLVVDGLFLIWGPTGAGKTFLLDALCFALYGEVPGERRHDTLRSDHAAPDASPCVELEFTAHDARWRIRRSPLHERAKKIGEGTTKVPPKATLERQEGDGWQPLAQNLTEVNEEIARLIGLSASQFQQVVLLPQGRFEKVLRSRSDDREKLLRTLFDTSVFASAASWLDEEAKQRRATAASLEQELRHLRSRAAERWNEVFQADENDGSLSDSVDSSEVDESAAGSLEASRSAGGPWPASQAQLDELVRQVQSFADQAATAAGAAHAKHSSANDDHNEAMRLAARWDRREHLRQELSGLAEAEASINANRQILRLADTSEGLRQVLDDERSARSKLEQCDVKLSVHYAALRECVADSLSLPDDFATPSIDDPALRERLAPLGTQIARHLNELSEFVEDASTAGERESAAIAERASAAKHLKLQAEQDTAAEEHDSKAAAAEAELRAAMSAADRISVLTATAERAEEQAVAAMGLQSLMPELGTARDTALRAKEATLDCRSEELDLRKRYLDGIAAVLAGELVDAMPCPVCGSAEHPEPAEPAGNAVRVEDVEAASAAVATAVRAQEHAEEGLRDIQSRIDGLRGQAGDVADDPDVAARRTQDADAELATATELAHNEPALRDAVADHEREARTARQQSSTAATAAELAHERAKTAETEAENLRTRIRQEIGELDPGEAVTSVKALEASLNELQDAARGHADARTALDALATSLARQLEGTPFATCDEARSALLDGAERDKLRSEVEGHDRATHDTRRDLGADELQDLPDDRPDTVATQDALMEAREAATTAGNHSSNVSLAHKAICGWAIEHRTSEAQHADALAEAELWSAVADRCSGRVSPKVSLQRWVLSAYLELICEFANRRLSSMTGGRYRLGVYRESERRGAQAGLGLRVHDTFTGAEREVSTLSGGETFQASLALALGVADVVTARSGGVRLEVLFVDEGFGTLDSEALQLAMDELDRLRDGGRAVGLISHVSELRERIRAGIEVHRTDKGSRISVGAISEL